MNLSNKIGQKNILVIGDVMLDTYYKGEVKRISPEAPVPVLKKLCEWSTLGGAANVAANLAAANQKVYLLSIIGKDKTGERLKKHLSEVNIETEMLLPLGKCTTEKVRLLAENNQQMMRFDNETITEISLAERIKLVEMLEKRIDFFDIIVISDYGKGLLTFEFTQSIIKLATKHMKYTLVDVKDKNYEKYSGAFLIKPNLNELKEMTNLSVGTNDEIIYASHKLREYCNSSYILTTCGSRGMVLVGEDNTYFVKADNREVFDVTGAGDTALAYLAAFLANGYSVEQSVEISNHAAGLQVTKSGTSVISLQEVIDTISNLNGDTKNKILDRTSAEKLRELLPNKRIVFTNGCFDILHIGHVKYLRKSAELGDILIIGLNSDNSVRRLKGKDRPINSENDRAELLASFDFVNYVVIFDEDSPYELIEQIKPDVLVKGGDYDNKVIIGQDIVESRGGKTVLIDYIEGKSTTEIIKRIRNEAYNE